MAGRSEKGGAQFIWPTSKSIWDYYKGESSKSKFIKKKKSEISYWQEIYNDLK